MSLFRKHIIRTLFALLMIGPLLLGYCYSLLYSLGIIGIMNDGFTLDHWDKLFTETSAIASIGYTLLLTIISIILVLTLALWTAWIRLNSNRQKYTYGLLILPLITAPVIAAFLWYYILSPTGILSRIAFLCGIQGTAQDFPRLVNDQWSFGIIVTHIFLIYPLFTLLFIFQNNKLQMGDLKNQAATLGANNRKFIMIVFIPSLIKVSLPVIWLYGVFVFGMYEVPLILGRSSPQSVSVFITEKLTMFNLYDISVGHAMAVLYSTIVFIVISIIVNNKRLRML